MPLLSFSENVAHSCTRYSGILVKEIFLRCMVILTTIAKVSKKGFVPPFRTVILFYFLILHPLKGFLSYKQSSPQQSRISV